MHNCLSIKKKDTRVTEVVTGLGIYFGSHSNFKNSNEQSNLVMLRQGAVANRLELAVPVVRRQVDGRCGSVVDGLANAPTGLQHVPAPQDVIAVVAEDAASVDGVIDQVRLRRLLLLLRLL